MMTPVQDLSPALVARVNARRRNVMPAQLEERVSEHQVNAESLRESMLEASGEATAIDFSLPPRRAQLGAGELSGVGADAAAAPIPAYRRQGSVTALAMSMQQSGVSRRGADLDGTTPLDPSAQIGGSNAGGLIDDQLKSREASLAQADGAAGANAAKTHHTCFAEQRRRKGAGARKRAELPLTSISKLDGLSDVMVSEEEEVVSGQKTGCSYVAYSKTYGMAEYPGCIALGSSEDESSLRSDSFRKEKRASRNSLAAARRISAAGERSGRRVSMASEKSPDRRPSLQQRSSKGSLCLGSVSPELRRPSLQRPVGGKGVRAGKLGDPI